jgi:hypothetical protein
MENMSKIQECIECIDGPATMRGYGDIFDTKMLQKCRNDLKPGSNPISDVNIRSLSESRPIGADDADMMILRQLIFGNLKKTTKDV